MMAKIYDGQAIKIGWLLNGQPDFTNEENTWDPRQPKICFWTAPFSLRKPKKKDRLPNGQQ